MFLRERSQIENKFEHVCLFSANMATGRKEMKMEKGWKEEKWHMKSIKLR